MDMEPWAQRVFNRMNELDLKQAELAKGCGIKEGSISGWFGKGKPTKMISGDNLIKVASLLDLTPEWIITGKGRKVASESQSQSVELDTEMLKSSIVSVKEALRAMGLELDAFLAAPMISYAYAERNHRPRVMSKAEYRAFDALITAKLQGELGYGSQGSSTSRGTGSAEIAQAARKKAGDSR